MSYSIQNQENMRAVLLIGIRAQGSPELNYQAKVAQLRYSVNAFNLLWNRAAYLHNNYFAIIQLWFDLHFEGGVVFRTSTVFLIKITQKYNLSKQSIIIFFLFAE